MDRENDQNKRPVGEGDLLIRSYAQGLILHMPDWGNVDSLLEAVYAKFSKSVSFFGEKALILGLEGRELSLEEELLVLAAIERAGVRVAALAGRDGGHVEKLRLAARQMEEKALEARPQPLRIHRGDVGPEMSIETPGSLLVLGNVDRQASLRAGGDIVVLGVLAGSAQAGIQKQIACLALDAPRLRIGGQAVKLGVLDSRRGRPAHFSIQKGRVEKGEWEAEAIQNLLCRFWD